MNIVAAARYRKIVCASRKIGSSSGGRFRIGFASLNAVVLSLALPRPVPSTLERQATM